MQAKITIKEVNMSEVKYAVNRLINSVWTISYRELEDGTIELLSHDRENAIGYEKERELPNFKLIEADNRIVMGALITNDICEYSFDWSEAEKHKFAVSNPKNVFSYS